MEGRNVDQTLGNTSPLRIDYLMLYSDSLKGIQIQQNGIIKEMYEWVSC